MKINSFHLRHRYPMVICIGEMNLSESEKRFPHMGILQVSEFDWNRDLSPWFAKKVFRQGEDFSGGADAFLEKLEEEVLPIIKEYQSEEVWMIGYSLAGLFTLYASSKCSWINGCASVSGSLWYPGWCDYLRTHPLYAKCVYLSVGEREKMTRNPVMKEVENCTEETLRLVSGYAQTVFEINPGGHFENEDERLFKGICWLNEETNNGMR